MPSYGYGLRLNPSMRDILGEYIPSIRDILGEYIHSLRDFGYICGQNTIFVTYQL